MVKEVLSARGAPHTTGDAHWAADTQVWFIMVKDRVGRFPNNPLWGEGWGWALYGAPNTSRQAATDYKVDCLGCHVPLNIPTGLMSMGTQFYVHRWLRIPGPHEQWRPQRPPPTCWRANRCMRVVPAVTV